jgi:multiple sugar transport system ATP-binding protein
VRNGGLVAQLGETALPVPKAIASERALEDWVGRTVVLGIRPEDLHGPEDGRTRADAPLPATIDRTEALGASLLVHFAVDAPAAKTEGIAAATGGGLEDMPLTGQGGAWFCAAFEPRSGARAGDRVDVTVDTQRLHFFDPETEASLQAGATESPTRTEPGATTSP